MKKAFLILALMAVCATVRADVTAEIISQNIDENGNIRVVTQYKIDGKTVDVKSQPCDNCTQGSRYSFQNFIDMTDAEIMAYIKADIGVHAKNLVARKFATEENKKLLPDISELTGQKVTATESVLKISDTVEWTVKTDGTKTVSSIEAIEETK